MPNLLNYSRRNPHKIITKNLQKVNNSNNSNFEFELFTAQDFDIIR
jgi:hypothetical protein